MATFTNRASILVRGGYQSVLARGTVNRSIFSAIMKVGAFTVLVKIAATLKEIIFAHRFGASDQLDAYLIAFLLPSFALNVAAGSFNAALIPTYTEVREREGSVASQSLFESVTVATLGLLLVVAVAMAATAHYLLPLLGSGFSPEKMAMTRRLFYMLLPVMPISGLFVTWAAILNSRDHFAVVALAPVITPIAIAAGVTALGDRAGIYVVVIAQLTGVILEGVLLAVALRRNGVSTVPRWNGLSPALHQVIRQYAPMIAAGFLMSGNGLVDQAMAAALGSGNVAILSYGNKLSAAILGICTVALSTAILPHFSRLTVARDWTGVRHSLKVYTRIVFFSSVAGTIVLLSLSKPIVRLLFERGAFTSTDTLLVALVQRLYILQLPFCLTGLLFVRLLSALKANRILLWGTCISFFLNMTLDYLLMRRIGVAGIALSTSLVYAAAFTFLCVMALTMLKRSETSSAM